MQETKYLQLLLGKLFAGLKDEVQILGDKIDQLFVCYIQILHVQGQTRRAEWYWGLTLASLANSLTVGSC